MSPECFTMVTHIILIVVHHCIVLHILNLNLCVCLIYVPSKVPGEIKSPRELEEGGGAGPSS